MNSRVATYTFLGSVSSLLLGLLAALIYYDPLQLFHASWHEKPARFHANTRQQAAGIINSYSFDSIVLGTSLLENTSANEASERLGGNFVNISISGSNFFERSLVLEYALRKKSLKRVIYSLDSVYLDVKRDNPNYKVEQFDYLYDRNPFNDIKAYLNDHYLTCLATFSQSNQCLGRPTGLDRPNAWGHRPSNIARYGGLEQWFAAMNNGQIRRAMGVIAKAGRDADQGKTIRPDYTDKLIARSIEYVDGYLLNIAKANPDTEFIFLFPPYSRIRYAIWAQVQLYNFEIYEAVIAHLVTEAASYPNVDFYGWDDRDFVDDVANYKDTEHYHPRYNSWMLSAIKSGDGMLLEDGLDTYLEVIRERAMAFDLIGIGRSIDEYLSVK